MTIPTRRSLRKPGALTSTVYSPGSKYRTSYLPSRPVVTACESPVAGCVIVTAAPETSAPDGSDTIPKMAVSSVWAPIIPTPRAGIHAKAIAIAHGKHGFVCGYFEEPITFDAFCRAI